MEAVASGDFFVTKFCKILTTKIQKGLFCLKFPVFQEKNSPKFREKSIY
jgi:hypothetical protein